MNPYKPRLLVATIFILAILAFSTYTTLVPIAYATQTPNYIRGKGMSILNNVVGVDIAKYAVTTKEYPADSSALYLGFIPQESVGYDLASENSRLSVIQIFTNGSLQMIQVIEKEGAVNLAQPATNVLETTRVFLGNYEKFTANPIYGELKSMLEDMNEAKNVNKTSGNIQLEMTVDNDYTNFKWYYTSNGVIAPFSKFITLGLKDGFLATFVDNWQLYNIGSTIVKLSQKEAVNIALTAAKAHSWSLKLESDALNLNNFNESNVRWTSLIFDNSLNANKTRNGDLLTLYPVWRIGIALNKWYGYMYGIEVDVWADTGEVRSVQEAWSSLPPPEGTPTADMTALELTINQPSVVAEISPILISGLVLSTIAATVIGIALVCVRKGKKLFSKNLPKPRLPKTGGILLCFLMLSVIFLTPIATVNAATIGAVIWGSESTGAGTYPNSWRKSQAEIDAQRYTSSTIRGYFSDYGGGYTALNQQGSMSTKNYVLSVMESMNSGYRRLAIVDFDHGVGNVLSPGEFHYMFEDNTGTRIGAYPPGTPAPENGIYDTEIHARIDKYKVTFAFINTCMSARINSTAVIPGYPLVQGGGLNANGTVEGMPYAFTKGRSVVDRDSPGFNIASYMSIDGYSEPDDGSQVYIGFPFGSASLSQKIPYPDGTYPYHYWVIHFFYAALYYDISVNTALDQASNAIWGIPFGHQNNQLRNGFIAYWWGFDPAPGSTMAVYGNGNIRLKCFADDFNDGNYNGWTVTQGSWTVDGGKPRSQQGFSLLRSGQWFTTNRHVRAAMKTITAGPNPWDVGWLIAKYQDSNNMVYGLLHTNGNIELAIIKNGQKHNWFASTIPAKSPFDTHTIDIDIVGNKAYMWVDGGLYHIRTDDWFDEFSGYSAFYSHQSSTAEFDDITIIKQ